jgi:hypothetical protein
MKKDISIALILTVVSNGLCALSLLGDVPTEKYLDYQQNYRHKTIPKSEVPCIKTGGGGIDIFLGLRDEKEKGGIMDG